MVKIESAQNWLESKRPDSARLPDSGTANGSKNGLRMQKLFSFKVLSISLKNGKIRLWKNFIKKRIFHRILQEYSMEYSAEYSGEYSEGSQSTGATWLARRPPRGPKAEWNGIKILVMARRIEPPTSLMSTQSLNQRAMCIVR